MIAPPGAYGLATIAGRRHGARHLVPRRPRSAARPPAANPRTVPAELAPQLGADPRRDVQRRLRRPSRSTSTRRRHPPRTPTCGCTCSATCSSRPNTINLDGIFGHLPIVVWTTAGPDASRRLARLRPALQRAGISAHGIDKFPRLLDYVTPTRVRIADASRVRLGAHLAPGTTVMHEGFVNFNAGTLGTSMVEGRISQGVVVGDGSDIGGGASIMGTLSGGGTAARRRSASARCSAPTRASASRSATTRSSRPGCT